MWKKNSHSPFCHNLVCNMNETSYLEQTPLTPFFSGKNERFLHVKPYEYFTKISKIFHMLFLSMFISFRPDRRSGQQIIVCTTRYLPIICNMLYNMNFKLFLVMRPSLCKSVFESSWEPFFTDFRIVIEQQVRTQKRQA